MFRNSERSRSNTVSVVSEVRQHIIECDTILCDTCDMSVTTRRVGSIHWFTVFRRQVEMN